MPYYDLPSEKLLRQQTAWLGPARARLLRRADIARRRRVLDLACGYGGVTGELVRRSGGKVTALDCRRAALSLHREEFAGAEVVCGKAEALPFSTGEFDLVFCQFGLLWTELSAAVPEIRRVLMPGGALAALEPDYGGMIEFPPETATRDLWIAALERAGADPCVGRKLPGRLTAAGFDVHVHLLERLVSPSPLRFDLLAELPLTDAERLTLDRARQAAAREPYCVAHLPMFLVTAEALAR